MSEEAATWRGGFPLPDSWNSQATITCPGSEIKTRFSRRSRVLSRVWTRSLESTAFLQLFCTLSWDIVRAMLQDPFRVFVYWEVRDESLKALTRYFSPDEVAGFKVVLKLIELTGPNEAFFEVERRGRYWLMVFPDREYEFEIRHSGKVILEAGWGEGMLYDRLDLLLRKLREPERRVTGGVMGTGRGAPTSSHGPNERSRQ